MESNWNYKKELELLKQKLARCSPSVKHEIQRIIRAEILEAPFADDVGPSRSLLISNSENRSKETQGSRQSVALKSKDLDSQSHPVLLLTLNVVHLMYQFYQDFQGTSKLLDDSEIKNSVAQRLFQTISSTRLEKFWQRFGAYIRKTVKTNEEPRFQLKLDLDNQGSFKSVTLKPKLLELDPALILTFIRLLHQFKRDFQGTSTLLELEDVEIENVVVKKVFQATSWAQLENLWEVFTVYVHKTVETDQPKCPLEVDSVLRKIFDYLPTHDLLNCRLVSRAWNEKSIHWEFPKRKKCIFNLSSEKIAQITQSNVTLPFIFSHLIINVSAMTLDDCNKFFNNYGAYVKTLELDLEDQEPLEDTSEDLEVSTEDLEDSTENNTPRRSSLFQILSNLRSIFQNINQIQDLVFYDSIPESVSEQPFVISRQELKKITLPNVRSLTLYIARDFSRRFAEGFFSLLNNVKSLWLTFYIQTTECQQVLDGVKKLKLTSLTLGCNSCTDLRHNLWTSLEPQKLKSLRTGLCFESDEDLASFQRFIQSQSQTLKSLELHYPFVHPDKMLRFCQLPTMSNLETLTFNCIGGCSAVHPVTPQQLPKLRSITLDLKKMSKCFGAGASFTTVRELCSRECVSDLEAADWRNLGSRFPNVEKLSVGLEDGIHGNEASELFRCFPNLEYISLTVNVQSGDNINLLFSGFTAEEENILSQLLATLSFPEELGKTEPANASLRNMKNLKELHLTIWVPMTDTDDEEQIQEEQIEKEQIEDEQIEEERILISKIGVQLGLMCIQPLDQLSIFGDFTISEEEAALLHSYHRNVYISPTSSVT